MAKARDAFRTISEVSDTLDTPAHVLRFWESKFNQIKPVKRAGGRRYYRPDDLSLLAGIKTLLHEQGMTIKGAQKLLREKGVRHVIDLGTNALGPDDDASGDVIDHIAEVKDAEPASDNVVPLAVADKPAPDVLPEPDIAPAAAITPAPVRPSGMIATIHRADRSKITENAAKIAPLLAKLSALRDQMRRA